MIQKADRSRKPGLAVGADIGASLAKLAVRRSDGRIQFRLEPTSALERIAREVESSAPAFVGVTGGGGGALSRLLGCDTARTDEFSAWRRGALEMLRRQGADASPSFLLVSLGTGTSALLVGQRDVVRVGGTALGGGTIVGLGAALTGASCFEQLTELARAGDRRRVDLLVSDIDPSGELPLPGDLNAASFAKLALLGPGGRADDSDLAHAIIGMVGENVGLICGALATSHGVDRIVYGGSTLRNNPALAEILDVMAKVRGLRAIFLENPEFAGALGALSLAAGRVELQPLEIQ